MVERLFRCGFLAACCAIAVAALGVIVGLGVPWLKMKLLFSANPGIGAYAGGISSDAIGAWATAVLSVFALAFAFFWRRGRQP